MTAGGVYCPLDPIHSFVYRETLIGLAGAKLLLSSNHGANSAASTDPRTRYLHMSDILDVLSLKDLKLLNLTSRATASLCFTS